MVPAVLLSTSTVTSPVGSAYLVTGTANCINCHVWYALHVGVTVYTCHYCVVLLRHRSLYWSCVIQVPGHCSTVSLVQCSVAALECITVLESLGNSM